MCIRFPVYNAHSLLFPSMHSFVIEKKKKKIGPPKTEIRINIATAKSIWNSTREGQCAMYPNAYIHIFTLRHYKN